MMLDLRDDESGTILPLVLGYVLIALAALFVCVSATSLYVTQKQLDGFADAAALAASDEFVLATVDGMPRARIEQDAAEREAAAIVAAIAADARVASVDTSDGASVRVRVAGEWHPPIVSLFLPAGLTLVGEASSRTALR